MGSGKTLKERAEEKLQSGNATQLGDPISLKAETSDTSPTKDEDGAKGRPKASNSNSSAKKGEAGANKKHKSLKDVAKETNPTMLGDPISLKAETADSEPTENYRGALNDKKSKSKL